MFPYTTQKNEDSQAFSGVFPIWKEQGETLAVLLHRFRLEHQLDEMVKLTYAGRLDPMAEGVVLVLAGESRFQKDELLGKKKTYEVEVVLGISTDTADMLGLIKKQSLGEAVGDGFQKETIEKALGNIKEMKHLPYPMYSSRPVAGKPLYIYARSGEAVQVPMKNVSIYELDLIECKEVSLVEYAQRAISVIERVVGDFRQEVICEQWKNLLDKHPNETVTVITIRTTVSSGTYMRVIAEQVGKKLGVPALAGKITRTALVD